MALPGPARAALRRLEHGPPLHLRVRVGGQVADDLVGGDAGRDGALDTGFADLAGYEVGVSGLEVREEGEEGGLQGRRGVGVEAVVGFDDEEALGCVGDGSGGPGVRGCFERGRGVGEGSGGEVGGGGGFGGKSCGEAGGIEVVGWGGASGVEGLVNDAEVGEILKDAALGRVEVGGGVGEAELEGGDEEEEGEDSDFGHFKDFGIVDVEEEEGPDLGVEVLKDEGEALFCNGCSASS